MTDRSEGEERALSADEDEEIRTACERHEFALREASLHGDVLTLKPETLEALPDAERLEALASDLESAGFRYVTFSIPEGDESNP